MIIKSQKNELLSQWCLRRQDKAKEGEIEIEIERERERERER